MNLRIAVYLVGNEWNHLSALALVLVLALVLALAPASHHPRPCSHNQWLDEEGEGGIWYPGTVRRVNEAECLVNVWFDDEILQKGLPWRLCKPFVEQSA